MAGKSVSLNIVWSFVQQFSSQIITFSVSVILARILMPEDFGTIALFSVLVSLSNALVDGGLTMSLIRSKDCENIDFNTVFIFNIIISFLLYALVYFCAPFIAEFYNLSILEPIIKVYSLIIVINALAAVQKTILVRELAFRKQFALQIPSLLMGSGVGVISAFKGQGVWSLVYMQLSISISEVFFFWITSKWFPKFEFNFAKFRYHFNFGYKITLSNVLNILFANAYTIIIGKFYSKETLGFYNRADTLKQLPVNNISNALNKVSFPLFAKVQDDNDKLKSLYENLMRMVIFIIAPLLTFMMISAKPIIRFLLTEKWLPAVPYLQILCISGLLYPLHSYNLNILQVKGRADLFLKLEVIKKVIIVIVIVIGLNFGVYGLVWGQVVISILSYFVNSFYSGRFINYSWKQQISDISGSLLVSALVGLLAYYIVLPLVKDFRDVIVIIIQFLCVFILYAIICKIFKFREVDLVLSKIKK